MTLKKSILIFLLCLVFLVGCQTRNTVVETEPVKIEVETQILDQDPINMKFAMTSGTISYFGVKLLYEQPTMGHDILWEYELYYSQNILKRNMLEGKIDVALIPMELALQIIELDAPYKLVGIASTEKPVVISKNPIEDFSEIKRQNVHVFYDQLHFFNAYLTYLNLESSDINTVLWTDEDAMITAFSEGRIEYAMLSAAQYKRLSAQNINAHLISETSRLIEEEIGLARGIPTGVLVVRSLIAEEYPELIQRIETELTISDVWLKRNTESARVYAQQLEIALDGSIFLETLASLSLSYEPNTQAKHIFRRYFNWLENKKPDFKIDRNVIY